jgi:lysozyme
MDNGPTIATQLIHYYEHCPKDSRGVYPYPDAKGIPTIGWGNTQYQDGTAVTLDDQPITQDEADALSLFYIQKFSAGVSAYANGTTPNQFGAFTSLAYNIGLGAFARSTALREYLQSNLPAAGDGIEMWDKAGGQVLKGLQRRRRAERMVFDGSDVQSACAAAEAAFP